MREPVETARSVEDFIKIVGDLGDLDYLWFRGQARAAWTLTPRLFRRRNVETSPKAFTQQVKMDDDETREAFIRRAVSLSDVKLTDKWDWYFAMQHYGADTRLLDWTDGALFGLYFAVKDNQGYDDAAVWVLDPWDLNQKVVHEDEVIPPGDPGTSREDRRRYDRWLRSRFSKGRWPRWPVAIYPGHVMRRIGAQRSCFTIHGSDGRGLELIAKRLKVPVKKIQIPSWTVEPIRKSLETCGIDESIVFPDLEGLGRLVNRWIDKPESRPHDGVCARLRPSKIDKGGVGVFAVTKIKKGTKIFPGDSADMVWVKENDLPKKPKAIRKLYEDFSVIKTDEKDSKTRYGCPISFDLISPSWFLNHSLRPNVGCDEDYYFAALKDIAPGEELTVDYSSYSEGKPPG